ncbi:MAG: hypothetical protein CL910_03735 [Deltaproteobacteria bacterium]|nr:hypothetical protein [Deltaproteobacteria bacterium]
MSRAWSQKRSRLFDGSAASAGVKGRKRDLVGRDMKRARRSRKVGAGWWIPALVGALAAALFLVALRNSILAVRYDLDVARARELELMKQQRTATARLRELRDPSRLRDLAREHGFERPAKVIDLGTGATRP